MPALSLPLQHFNLGAQVTAAAAAWAAYPSHPSPSLSAASAAAVASASSLPPARTRTARSNSQNNLFHSSQMSPTTGVANALAYPDTPPATNRSSGGDSFASSTEVTLFVFSLSCCCSHSCVSSTFIPLLSVLFRRPLVRPAPRVSRRAPSPRISAPRPTPTAAAWARPQSYRPRWAQSTPCQSSRRTMARRMAAMYAWFQ